MVFRQPLLLDFQKSGKAHSSTLTLYVVLNGIFDMAFMDDSIPISPMLKVKRPVPRKDEKMKEEAEKALTAKELSYVLQCVAKEPLKHHRIHEENRREIIAIPRLFFPAAAILPTYALQSIPTVTSSVKGIRKAAVKYIAGRSIVFVLSPVHCKCPGKKASTQKLKRENGARLGFPPWRASFLYLLFWAGSG